MILTAILNAILAAGVIVMVVTPLVWAIRTQRRDHVGLAATEAAAARTPQARDPTLHTRPQYKPLVGRA